MMVKSTAPDGTAESLRSRGEFQFCSPARRVRPTDRSLPPSWAQAPRYLLMISLQNRGVQIQLVSSREKQPRQPWAKDHGHEDKPCRAVIEHFQQRIILALGLKVLAVQFQGIDAMAFNRAMHEPGSGHRGDGENPCLADTRQIV